MWAEVSEFAVSVGYERLAKVCKVSGGKGMLVIKIAFRARPCVPGHLEVCCGDCSERLGLQCVLRHYGVGRVPREVCQVSLLIHSLLEQGFGKSL